MKLSKQLAFLVIFALALLGVWRAFGQVHNLSNVSNVTLLGVGAVLSSATTIAPTNRVHHVSGTTTVVTITVPTNFPVGGDIILIPDGVFLFTAAGNISLAGVSVVSKALVFVWDGSKWNPSYIA